MVKTRHQVDPSDSDEDDFVTLPIRRSRRSQNHTPQLNGYDSGEESEPAANNGDEEFDAEVTMKRRSSQQRMRSLRAAAAASKARSAAALAGDSDGDDIPKKRVGTSPRKVGRPRKVEVSEADPDSSGDEDYDQESEIRKRASRTHRPPRDPDSSVDEEQEADRPTSGMRRRAGRRPLPPADPDSSVDEDQEPAPPTRRTYKHEPEPERDSGRHSARSRELTSRNRRSSSGVEERHQHDSSFEEGIRRSTRQRKLMYDTYDQKLIDRHMAIMADDEPLFRTRRPRRPSDHSPREIPVEVTKKKKVPTATLR